MSSVRLEYRSVGEHSRACSLEAQNEAKTQSKSQGKSQTKTRTKSTTKTKDQDKIGPDLHVKRKLSPV